MKVSIVNPKLTQKATDVIEAQKAFNEAPYDDYCAANYSNALRRLVDFDYENVDENANFALILQIKKLYEDYRDNEDILHDYASTLANLRGKERFSSQALNELYTENPDDEVVAEAYIRGLHNLSDSQKDVNIRLVCFNEAERVFKQFQDNEKIASSFMDFASQISYYYDYSDCSNAEKFLDKVEEAYLAFSWNDGIAFNYATAQTHALCAIKQRDIAEKPLSELKRLYDEKMPGEVVGETRGKTVAYTVSALYLTGLARFLVNCVTEVKEAKKIMKTIRALKKEVGEFKFLDYSDAVKYYKEILKNQKEKLQ